MQNTVKINEDVTYIGASDRRLALFENSYPLANGVSYNTYLISDGETALLDTADASVMQIFMENLFYALDGKKLDHIIIDHMEPDHCASLGLVMENFPEAKIYGTMQVKKMIYQFYGVDVESRFVTVKEGDTLTIGKHTLQFVAAPMVHWPEVMMTYDTYDKILYTADAFGVFGALSGNLYADETDIWTADLGEARRYYTNIVGKYGVNVQNVLKKAAALDIKMFCPLHGPVIREDLGYYLDKYDKWSSYTPEDQGVVIVYASIYGGTENAVEVIASKLAARGIKNIKMYDVSKTHVSELVAEAFRVSHLVLAAPTLDAGLFPAMETFLLEIKRKNLCKRTVALVENGTWAPAAAKEMTAILESMKDMTILPEKVTVRSTALEADTASMDAMADALAASLNA
ncbi:MAG: FprA family A-type flavoprotein [Lachnospiraceae bacterium]|nr:FprA family A-type flavoprotein [Lachnospiraceae bacterium]